MSKRIGSLIGSKDCKSEYLVCAKCGCEQEDNGIVLMYKVKYPGMQTHHIPYVCGACMDNKEA